MTSLATPKKQDSASTQRLCTFYVGGLICGLDLSQIREITTPTTMTKVYLAPPIIKGIVNIRGQIITIIDLKKRLDISSKQETAVKKQAILVDYQGLNIGLLVDQVQDILPVDPKQLQPPPAHMAGVQGRFFKHVYKQDTHIIAVLNLGEILKQEDEKTHHVGENS